MKKKSLIVNYSENSKLQVISSNFAFFSTYDIDHLLSTI